MDCIIKEEKKRKWHFLIKRDIEHRLFGMEFRYPASLVEGAHSVFVPAGWDNAEKINIDAKANKVSRHII